MQKRKSRSKRPKYKQGQGDGTAEEAEHLEFEGYGDADQITPFGFKDFKEALPEDSNTEDRKASDYAKCYWCNKQAFDLKKCTRCKIAQYCDRQCQKAHWSDHKLTCREGGAPSFSTSETLHSKKEESASKEHQSCVNVVHSRPLHEQVPCFNCKEHRETLKKCNQCQIAMYCDKECQKAHWPEHKTVCRHLSNKDSGKNSDQGCASFLTSGSRTQPTNGDDEESCCLCCGKSKTGLIKCSGCQTVNYCNEQCELDDRLGHGKACGNYSQFSKALDKVSKLHAQVHGCKLTDLRFPPPPNPFLDNKVGRQEGKALLLEIVGPYYHFCRHGVYVQDVEGEVVHMLFYHEKEEELSLFPITMSRLLSKGNFMRWFYPRWRFFTDGTVGFRIDHLEEIEFIQNTWSFTFADI